MEEKDKLKRSTNKKYEIECLVRDLMINPRVKRIIVIIEYDRREK